MDAITLRTLGPLVTPRASKPLSILDPACGNGAFLLGAQRYFMEHRESGKIPPPLLHGIDVDPASVDFCRQAFPHADIHCGNALLGPDGPAGSKRALPPFRGPALDWPRAFPTAVAAGGFDAILGNPPWVSLAGRFAPARVPRNVVAYFSRRFDGSTYLPNLFEYFVVLALEWTRPGGVFGLVVPDRLAFNRQYGRLRERLLRETSLLSVLYRVPFPGVTADTMILVVRKEPPRADHRVEIGDLDANPEVIRQADMARQAEMRFERCHRAPVEALLRKMRAPGRVVPLGEVAEIASGFGGRSPQFTERQIHPGQIPVLKGFSIRRYGIGRPLWFDFRKDHLTGRTVDVTKLGAAPKILLRKTGNRLIAALDDAGIFPDQSLYLLHRSQVDLRFLLGVLNSAPLTYYLRACCLTNPHSMAQVKKCDLVRLPVPRCDSLARDAIVGLVQKRMDEERLGADPIATEQALDARIAALFCLTERQLAVTQRTGAGPV